MPEEVPDYEDEYNEVDVDSQAGVPPPPVEEDDWSNHVGHVVALTLSFFLVLLVLLALVLYFYWARDAFKGFMKQHANKWTKNVSPPPVTEQLEKPRPPQAIVNISGPIGAPPPVPPRRQRSTSQSLGGEPALLCSPSEEESRIRSISSPTRVTINGIAVNPNSLDSIQHARLHVPE